jgi:hypothetical protein
VNASCLLIKALTATGPSPVPLSPCCTAALVAMHDPDRPEEVWLCPLEEQQNDLAHGPRRPAP